MKFRLAALLLALTVLSTAVLAASRTAPEIILPARKGEFHLSRYQGKVVYVDFWASWCPPCRKSFPWMNEIQARYADSGLIVVAINVDADRQAADRFLQEYQAAFKVAFDTNGDVASNYEVIGMPSSFLVGRDGKIHESYVGFTSRDKAPIEAAIRRLLKK